MDSAVGAIMTLIFMDGFDDQLFLNGKWDLTASAQYSASGRNGGCFTTPNSSANLVKYLKPADEHATLILGFAYKTSSFAAAPIVSLRSDAGATTHTQLYTDGSSGVLSVRRNATTLTASTNNLILNQWHYIEFKCTLGAAAYYEVRVNGVMWISGTNNTKNAGTKTVYDTVALLAGSAATCYFDDFYVLNGAGSINNNFLGDVAIETLYPNGNGSSSQWVGSDADSVNNYLLVNEAGAPVTTNYTGSSVVGNRDLYALSDMARVSGTVYGVQTTAYTGNADAGARAVKQVMKSGATTSVESASTAVTTTYAPLVRTMETDPNTGSLWTIANANAIEVGIEVAS
jgi:hypothetical protein